MSRYAILPITLKQTGNKLHCVVPYGNDIQREAKIWIDFPLDFPLDVLECDSGATITFEATRFRQTLGRRLRIGGEVTPAGYELLIPRHFTISGKVSENYTSGIQQVGGFVEWTQTESPRSNHRRVDE